MQRRSHGAERHRQLLDLAVVERAPDGGHEPRAFEQPAGQAHVHERDDVAAVHSEHPFLEALEIAGGVGCGDQCTDRRSADEIRPNAFALEHSNYAQVGPSARRAAAEHEPDARAAPLWRREY